MTRLVAGPKALVGPVLAGLTFGLTACDREASAPEVTVTNTVTVTPSASAPQASSEQPSASTAPSSASPSSAQPRWTPKTQETNDVGTLKLGYATVTLTDKEPAKWRKDTVYFWVKVCIHSTPPGYEAGFPTSAADWELEVVTAELSEAKPVPRLTGVVQQEFPTKELKQGECGEGWVTYDESKVPDSMGGYLLSYNSRTSGDKGRFGLS